MKMREILNKRIGNQIKDLRRRPPKYIIECHYLHSLNTNANQKYQDNYINMRDNNNNNNYHNNIKNKTSCNRMKSMFSSKITTTMFKASILVLLMAAPLLANLALVRAEDRVKEANVVNEAANVNGDSRSTQPSVDRQLSSPGSPIQPSAPQILSSDSKSKSVAVVNNNNNNKQAGSITSQKASKLNSEKKEKFKASMASQQNYDKYQLKASNSQSSSSLSSMDPSIKLKDSSSSINEDSKSKSSAPLSPSTSSSSSMMAQKKSGYQQATGKKQGSSSSSSSSLSLLKRFLPTFMSSAPVATAAAAAMAAAASSSSSSSSSNSVIASETGKWPTSNSRSSSGSGNFNEQNYGIVGKISNIVKFVNNRSKKSGQIPDHASSLLFSRRQTLHDRQAASTGFGLSNLLSNPLSLGLLFSAPLIPSLLLTPLAIAGLSPAMSAINNLFGDDDEAQASTPASSSPLANLLGSSSPLSSIIQGSSGLSSASGSGSSGSPSIAMQAVQSILGQPSTTERPLFNPGIFSGMQSAASSMINGASQGSSAGSSIAQASGASISGSGAGSSSGPIRSILGGSSLFQTAASMISPSFAAPPTSGSSSSSSSSSSADSDDGPGLMSVASDVFDKVANYMGSEKEVSQASSSSGLSGSSLQASSPLSSIVGLSSFSPFQLSTLFASTPIGSAIKGSAQHHSSSSASSSLNAGGSQKPGFFGTLKNIYELFSSSFLRRQEVGPEASNECQQRLICELHQRAMNSKLFRRSVQSNLMELANLDKILQDQINNNNKNNIGTNGNNYNNFQIQIPNARIDSVSEAKSMLSEFLKASDSFKRGDDLVSCSKMFPKCSRSMLFSFANSHLNPSLNQQTQNGEANGESGTSGSKTISKLSNLMKKMKFKPFKEQNWKLRKGPKTGQTNVIQATTPITPTLSSFVNPSMSSSSSAAQLQPLTSDYLSLASINPGLSASQAAQMAPAESYKIAQQILMMSQQQPKSQASQLQYPVTMIPQYNQRQPQASQLYLSPGPNPLFFNYAQQQQQQQQLYQQPMGRQQQPQTIYTDSIQGPISSSSSSFNPTATESPYFIPPQQAQSSIPSSMISEDMRLLGPQQMQQQQQQQQQQPQQQPQQMQSQQQVIKSSQGYQEQAYSVGGSSKVQTELPLDMSNMNMNNNNGNGNGNGNGNRDTISITSNNNSNSNSNGQSNKLVGSKPMASAA